MNDDRKGRGKELAAAVLKYVILISWALTTIIPLLWVFVNSFKTSEEIVKNGVALPSAIQFNNYKTIMSYPDLSMSRAFLNSFIISGSVVVGVVLVAGLAAFALGRFRFQWTNHDSQLCNDQQASDQRNSCGGHYPSDCGKSLLFHHIADRIYAFAA